MKVKCSKCGNILVISERKLPKNKKKAMVRCTKCKHAIVFAIPNAEELEGEKTEIGTDNNQKIQNALREKLKHLGYRVLVIGDPQRALVRFMELDPAEDRPADCVIFGCSGLGYEGIQAFNEFADNEETRDIPAIILVTSGVKKYLPDAKISDQRVPLDLPLKFAKVRATLQELLGKAADDDAVDAQAVQDGAS